MSPDAIHEKGSALWHFSSSLAEIWHTTIFHSRSISHLAVIWMKYQRILQEKDGLVRTRNVPTTKAVAIYKETISRQFNDVLRAVMKLSKDYLNFQPCTLEGAEANKWIWFERCIGALDGTYIPVK
ncbi:hypothetical protein GmHk_02G004634 [Glycine max]|nr:hypothetical protein GmHk_02G004634 [Glycine max]